MKKTILALAVLLLTASGLRAQWSIGLNVGPDLNTPVVNTQYAYNRIHSSGLGGLLAVPVQYDFKDWVGLVVEPGIQYRHSFYKQASWYKEEQHDLYLEVPVMVQFSFGGETVRGFVNLGPYAGYWLAGWKHQQAENLVEGGSGQETSRRSFSDQDCRADFGLCAGIGLRWLCNHRVSMSLEYRYNYDCLTSVPQHKVGNYDRYDNLHQLTLGIRFNQLGKEM